ncbi:hypothetical protein TTHERM_00469040 (macronuclear) [Tetrahymena thermophila SB210]|uniref:VHS domain protein n=1 Tax=Tetrahymena thermophila (strain SB210) TaxID=312017 RepID=I7LXL1_TETTS|nr:hypothetical protein TTHERM_00469040 [Tetrahymena thermophila SB210]EAS04855.2 hypothetical protein TTHERM_00469040 [Tetrahymena thermophila SB210]|eukprot:XP_001025100.2 hypothetical protein TTHERM_00469040 [Tetrahymena thermophila SB210]
MMDLDPNSIVNMLSNPEQYKKSAKPYKQAINQGDMKTMLVMSQVIQECLQRQRDEKPMVLLNSIRFVKETLDKSAQRKDYQELIAERILPEMFISAQFDKEKKEEDRGKFYFGDKPSNELAILGNSFFRLVLECLLVWSNWFPNTMYSEIYQQLVQIGVTFPEQLNYFKEENEKRQSQISQGNINSSQRNSTSQKNPSLTQIQQNQQQGSNTSIPQQVIQIKSYLTGLNLNITRSGEFSKILVQVLVQFQKVKESIRVNLLSEQLNVEQFNQNLAEIKQFSNDFKVLIEKAQHIESSPSFEQHLTRLFNESEFSDNFLADIQAYKQKSILFEEIKRKYTIIIRPLRTQSSMSPTNQNDENQNFNEYNKNYNQNLKQNSDQVIEQGSSRFGPTYNQEDIEEEEKYNQQNSYKRNEGNNFSTPTPNPDYRGNHHQSQFSSNSSSFNVNNNNNNNNNQFINSSQLKQGQSQYTSNIQQGSEINGSQRLIKKQSFKHLFEQNDMDKYKMEMRSGSSYRKMSPSPSNQSSYYSSSIKSAVLRKPGGDRMGIDSQMSLQKESEEVIRLKKQLEDTEKERNMWKQKYEEIYLELQKLKQSQ